MQIHGSLYLLVVKLLILHKFHNCLDVIAHAWPPIVLLGCFHCFHYSTVTFMDLVQNHLSPSSWDDQDLLVDAHETFTSDGDLAPEVSQHPSRVILWNILRFIIFCQSFLPYLISIT